MFRTKILVAFGFLLMAIALVALGSTVLASPAGPLENESRGAALSFPFAQSCGTPSIQYAYANPVTIYPGQVTTLYWGSVLGAQAAYLQFPDGHREGIGTPGSRQVNPYQTSTYYIIGVCGPNQAQAPITVNVQGGPTCTGAPQLNGFTANPSAVSPGQGSTLSWGAVKNADYVQLSSQINGGSGVPTPGNMVVYPKQTTTYYLTAWCQGNSAQAQVTITVNNAPPTPTPPPANANQIRGIQTEKTSKGELKVTVNYYWNGEDSPATIQSIAYNSSNQPVTNLASTGIIAGYVKYVIQSLTSVGGQGAMTKVTSCMVGRSGTDLACLSVPVP